MGTTTDGVVPARARPGTAVLVWCPSLGSWVGGFDVVRHAADGVVVRRRSDGSELPVVFGPDAVQPEHP